MHKNQRIFGRQVNLIWWGCAPYFRRWVYPARDLPSAEPGRRRMFTGYYFGLFEVRVWWAGW